MDGYAFAFEEHRQNYRLVGSSLAGHPYSATLNPGESVRITTGATLPAGADTVIMQEHTTVDSDQLAFEKVPSKGQFARLPGSDTKKGTEIISTGRQLTPADIGMLASQGIDTVSVRKKLCAAVISTGDELVPDSRALTAGQIYDSNRPLLFGLVTEAGYSYFDGGTIRDDPDALQQAFENASRKADVIITSGGVSVGEADFVRALLQEHGQINFWKIAMKPGRPLTVAKYANTPFFGLPGNPVSVAVTFEQLVKPALEKISGLAVLSKPVTVQARCMNKLTKQPGRLEFQRGILSKNSQGDWQVKTTGLQDSHVLSSLSNANCYVELPVESAGADVGETVNVQLRSHRITSE